jgi:uncharacterized protein (DUF1778 family)
MPSISGVHEDEEKGNRHAPGRSSQHGPLERVTVNLTARAARALNQAAQITGDSRTDTINRALVIYAYLEQISESKGAIYVRESPDEELQLLKIF